MPVPSTNKGELRSNVPLNNEVKIGRIQRAVPDITLDDYKDGGRTSRSKRKDPVRTVEVASCRGTTLRGSGFADPMKEIGDSIKDALDPTKAHGRVRTIGDMTKEERERLIRESGKRIELIKSGMDPVLLVPIKVKGVRCRQATSKALRISYNAKSRWVPKSMLLSGTTLKTPGCTGVIVVPRWYALKNGLIDGMAQLNRSVLDNLRTEAVSLALDWRKRVHDSASRDDDIGEFGRGVRVALRACALELVRLIRKKGGTEAAEKVLRGLNE